MTHNEEVFARRERKVMEEVAHEAQIVRIKAEQALEEMEKEGEIMEERER